MNSGRRKDLTNSDLIIYTTFESIQSHDIIVTRFRKYYVNRKMTENENGIQFEYIKQVHES